MQPDLSEVPLFRGLAPSLLDGLARHIRGFAADEVLIRRGDPATHVLVIRSGAVDVTVNGVFLITRHRDDIIGEQAFINETLHSADCIAKSPVQVVCISREIWRDLLEETVFVRNLLEALSIKLRDSTNERYVRFRTEQRLFTEFRSHVSREVLDDLLTRGHEYGAPQQIDDIAILFSDIRGFTAYVHSNEDAKAVASELSAYLSGVTDAIHAHGGFVDKFIGDAVMAFWGYPGLPRPHNDVILNCAEEMLALASGHTFGGKPARIGIGINQGRCFMGNIGNAEKRQFTIIGDAVNVASRLESKSKDLGDVVIGATFFNGLSSQQQSRLQPHHDQDVRGTGTHTLYSLKREVEHATHVME